MFSALEEVRHQNVLPPGSSMSHLPGAAGTREDTGGGRSSKKALHTKVGSVARGGLLSNSCSSGGHMGDQVWCSSHKDSTRD